MTTVGNHGTPELGEATTAVHVERGGFLLFRGKSHFIESHRREVFLVAFGHPPPNAQSLRSRLTERLSYLDDLLRGGLNDVLPATDDLDAREAHKERLKAYLSEAQSLLEMQAEAAVDRVLMDVPVRLVDQETGDAELFTVVAPHEADPTAGRISFLSPLGSALLLRRVEETVILDAPGGQFVYRVVVIGEADPT